MENNTPNTAEHLNFIEEIIEHHNQTNKYNQRVHTRFPPEPNGYLHLGHAKSICLNFLTAQKYGGLTNLRFDDTNPAKEEQEYVDSIKNDIQWLGFKWNNHELYASDYFETMYQLAIQLIEKGSAYIDFSTPEELRAQRGTPTQPATPNQYRNTPVAENLAFFEKMKNGDFEEGTCILRAKIDLNSPNMHMRDPAIYRIKKAHHHRTGNKWNIYPMYDYAHCISDSIEGITHSLCTLEFEVHRPLYDWILQTLNLYQPQQIEFSRLNLNYTVMSKRKLLLLVQDNHVKGWDDPRLATLSGLRRRGYTPEAIRNFAYHLAGISKREQTLDYSVLEFAAREHLNKIATRVMVIQNPLKLIITNYPDNQTELLTTENNPEDPNAGTRELPFAKELYIEKDDFVINPPKKYFRLAPNAQVRLKSAYIVHCHHYITDNEGNVTEIHCTYHPNSKSGNDTSGIKVQGTIQWVNAPTAIPIHLNLYDRLFTHPNPAELGDEFIEHLNPNSLKTITALAEPSLLHATLQHRYQFMRQGYFCLDKDTTPQKIIFNQTTTLKDTWTKTKDK